MVIMMVTAMEINGEVDDGGADDSIGNDNGNGNIKYDLKSGPNQNH